MKPGLKLYNTLTREIEDFNPSDPKAVGLYVCGITPYDFTHLGHARTYCSFDMLKRYLILRGYGVIHIQNVTDIDDKIIKRAADSGEQWNALSSRFMRLGHEDLYSLNVLKATRYPKVTEHIPEIISMIQSIMDNGFAYKTSSGVYFDVQKFQSYGSLSAQKLDSIKAGARIEVDEEKKSPADFALWKHSKEGEPFWDSPFGKGRPGWHIECSAMACKYLSQPIDIHGGGYDLIFPHHENEIAQAEASTGSRFVNLWMHCGFLTIKGEKMAKSLGNFITIRELLKKHTPNAVRLFFAKTHYRSQIDFSETTIDDCENAVQSIANAISSATEAIDSSSIILNQDTVPSLLFSEFILAMDSDLNSPIAVSKLFELVSYINSSIERRNGNLFDALAILQKMLWVFGIIIKQKEFGHETTGLVSLVLEVRDELRKKKEFGLSDKIRDGLQDLGIKVGDGKTGSSAKLS